MTILLYSAENSSKTTLVLSTDIASFVQDEGMRCTFRGREITISPFGAEITVPPFCKAFATNEWTFHFCVLHRDRSAKRNEQ